MVKAQPDAAPFLLLRCERWKKQDGSGGGDVIQAEPARRPRMTAGGPTTTAGLPKLIIDGDV